MKRVLILVLILPAFAAVSSRAVQQEPGGAYFQNDPVSPPVDSPTQYIPGWSAGWGQPAGQPVDDPVTGWDYVGTVNGASGVYVGNGWVLTAGHVGSGTFQLDGSPYYVITSSVTNVGSADLTLFQVTAPPLLPNLILATSDPAAYNGVAGSNVAMLGYGGANVETWGYNTVTNVNFNVQIDGFSSIDFLTATAKLSATMTNSAQVVGGDSGGGDFIFNVATSQWELAGINEVRGTFDSGDPGDPNSPTYAGDQLSGFVQLDTYATLIGDITGVPEPSEWLLVSLGVGAVWTARRYGRAPAS